MAGRFDDDGNLRVAIDNADEIVVSGEVEGTVANGAVDSANPFTMAGKVAFGAPTHGTAGRVGTVTVGFHGQLFTTTCIQATGADGFANTTLGLSESLGADPLLPVTGGYVFNGTTWDMQRGDTNGTYSVAKGATTGGLTPVRVVTGTTGVIKAGAGQLYKLHSVRNANAAVRYLHLYNKATAPTLSTDTPVLTISLAASSVQNDINIGGDIGVAFANGIAWAYTTDNIAIPATAGTSTELMFSGAYK